MKTTDFFITNAKGFKLAASLDAPFNGKIKAYGIFAHCFTCSKELKAISNIHSVLTRYGIAMVRFDMTGIGSSEGEFSDTNFTTQLSDFSYVVDYMTDKYEFPVLFIGHSLGGSVALFSAFKYPAVKAIVTIASPAEPSSLSQKLKNTKAKAIRDIEAETEIGGVKFTFKPQFFKDIESYELKSKLSGLKKPYLVLHSPADTYSDYSNAEALYNAASQPKSIISLYDIDHLMLEKKSAYYAGELIGTWSEKYLFS